MVKERFFGYSHIKIPKFSNRDNSTLIETKEFYSSPGVMNAEFIFTNKWRISRNKYKTLINDEIGHAKENNMLRHGARAIRTCFFSAEIQNRLHGGKTGAEFRLKNWYITYYKMPMKDRGNMPRFIYKMTNNYTITREFNERTEKYEERKDTRKNLFDMNEEFENALEDYMEE